MVDFAVIVENDESPWDDVKGDLYHYPVKYRSLLTPGCRVLYYKGKMTNPAFASERMSPAPHYFGVARIGEAIEDPEAPKKNLYCEILGYHEFAEPIPNRDPSGAYFSGSAVSRRPAPANSMTRSSVSGSRKIRIACIASRTLR